MSAKLFQFSEFELDLEAYELRCNGQPAKLERIPMRLLVLLIENRGKLVSRESIVQHIWGTGTFLETEHSINTAVNKLRRVLRDDPSEPRFIATVLGAGYRFVGAVRVEELNPKQSQPHPDNHNYSSAGFPGAGSSPLPAASSPLLPGARENVASELKLPPSVTGQKLAPAIQTDHPREIRGVSGRQGRWKLAWAVGLAAIVIATTVALWLAVFHHRSLAGRGQIDSIAVLPFANLSKDQDQEYFVDGMTDALITDLALQTGVRVISHTSVMQFKGTRTPMPEIAAKLNVDAVVEGTVLRSGDQVRISVQLLDARRDLHLWAKIYDRSLANVLDMQQEVTKDISNQIATTIHPNSAPSSTRHNPASPEAYDNYLRGKYFWNQFTPTGTKRSIEYYSRAIELDPSYAQAYAARGESHIAEYTFSLRSPSSALALAQADASTAVRLDDSIGQAHAILGRVATDLWDWNTSERELKRAVALEPSNESTHRMYSGLLLALGNHGEALTEAKTALILDPLGQFTNLQLGYTFLVLQRYDEAIDVYRRALEVYPDSAAIRLDLALAYLRQNRTSEALAEAQKYESTGADQSGWLSVLVHVHGQMGQRARAEDALSRLLRLSEKTPVHPTDVAFAYLGLGERQKALDWLEKAYAERDPAMTMLKTDPDYASIREEPRYKQLLQRMNFPQ